ncbi:GNAT family N-acetyltransferase [Streptomyces sp. Ru62]|uniref:GNAT family N-acetyltransferase n=1 Tax=Streptomyces sp. Ru62 TaxID=2080745 RepID=UPI000CDD0A8B|nr:GNAT family N-acetyltransferase [Streptomyces sp. Ru62]POX63025.1 GNAT family N-acetyltransferase [Streptomyces sp. Ru62]
MNTRGSTAHATPSVQALLANCRDYWLGWGAQDRQDDRLTYYRSGVAHPSLNAVLRLRAGDRIGPCVERATRALAGVPWLWWVGPDSAPGVRDRLVGHGATLVGSMPIMAVGTDRLPDVSGPPGLEVETVDGTDALTEWVRVYSASFGFAADLLDGLVRCEATRPDAPALVRFTGRLHGEPVGTALMFAAHGVAGVYVVTTAEDHRRQGIGTALTAAALRAGRERGLRTGTLQAGSLGVGLYRRMGFRTVDAYELFRLPPP